jgi:glycosyltransferase involved in cell wall biosynthesis
VDLVIEAFNRLGLPLLVVGDGPERRRLEAIAGPTVRLLGRRSEAEVNELMGRCRAYVYAGLEDFGIAPVEAMAAGAPVIGLGQGGLLDSVRCLRSGVSGPTGLLFPEQTVASLQEAVAQFHDQELWRRFSSEALRRWAERFAPERFQERLLTVLERSWEQHQRRLAHDSRPGAVPLV